MAPARNNSREKWLGVKTALTPVRSGVKLSVCGVRKLSMKSQLCFWSNLPSPLSRTTPTIRLVLRETPQTGTRLARQFCSLLALLLHGSPGDTFPIYQQKKLLQHSVFYTDAVFHTSLHEKPYVQSHPESVTNYKSSILLKMMFLKWLLDGKEPHTPNSPHKAREPLLQSSCCRYKRINRVVVLEF